MDDVKAGIQYVFQTDNPLTFAVSGTGHAGMECALLNLLEKGETILVVQNGVWGQRAASLAERLGLKVHRLIVPEGEVIGVDDFAEVSDRNVRGLFRGDRFLTFWTLSLDPVKYILIDTRGPSVSLL